MGRHKAASPMSTVLPRSLLFASPSPHRYSTASEQDVFDWASPIQPCEDTVGSTVADSKLLDAEESASSRHNVGQLRQDTQLPPPLPTGGSVEDWHHPAGSAAPAVSSLEQASPAVSSPAKQAASSPSQLGLRGSPARLVSP